MDHVTIRAPYHRIHKLIFGDDPEESAGEKYSAIGGLPQETVTTKMNEVEPIASDVNSPSSFMDSIPLPKNVKVQNSKPGMEMGTVPPTDYDRLKEMLGNPPTRDEFEPSKTRRFLGGLAGGLTGAAYGPEVGSKTAQNIVDKPYNEAFQDWSTRTGALGKQNEIELDKKKLDLQGRAAESAGLNAYSNFVRSSGAVDPDLQGDIAGAKKTAEVSAEEPSKIRNFNREQTGREILEDIRTEREYGLEGMRQRGRKELSVPERESREKIAREQINSRENIAKLNRNLRKQISDAGKNQRISPNQQYLAQVMAENEVSQIVPDKDELDNIFDKIINPTTGAETYKLKNESEIPEGYKAIYKKRKKQAEENRTNILKGSFNPNGDEPDDDDEFDIEEVGPGNE